MSHSETSSPAAAAASRDASDPTAPAIEPAVSTADTSAPEAGQGEPATTPLHVDGRYERRGGVLDSVRRYVMVTKPRIIELLLVTTVPTMVVAEQGWPGTWLVVATVLGGTMSAASANAWNNFLDRDIDRLMARTSGRPTARDEISPLGTAVLATTLGIAGFVWLWGFVNLTAALLATGAIFFYIFVYTLGLKRRTDQGVVIGGIAGCVPVLTGWAAVSGGSLADPRPWLLFAIMLWWQPPHFWALAMKYREDYARAGLPMLPVTQGNDEATRHILLYSYLLAAIVLMTIGGGGVGWLFIVVSVALTVIWLLLAHELRRQRTVAVAMRLFHYSTIYLGLLFIAVAIDAVI